MIGIGIVAVVLMAAYTGYLVRMAWFFQQKNSSLEPTDHPRVSVIVPVRNEARDLGACLDALMAQDYPNFEVLVVDDHSEDGTVAVVEQRMEQFPHLRWMPLATETDVAFKKAAVAAGIAATEGEVIVTTDGDCTMGPQWLSALVAHMDAATGLVSGPVQLTGRSIFQQFQALEFMGLIAVGAGAIRAGSPTLCNGANLAYRRKTFTEVGGFAGIDHIASGDDELLMHKIAGTTGWKVAFARDRSAVVETAALRTWSAFKAQRIRWVSKSTHYQQSRITRTLVLSYLAILFLPILAVLSIFFPELWPWLLASFSLKVLGELFVLLPAAGFFGNLHLLVWLIPEQFAHIAYVLWVGLAGNRKSYTWKGRQVR